MFESYSQLNEIHRDVLQELGNIGTGNAITALSQLTRQPIEMDVPQVKIIDYHQLPDLIGSRDSLYTGVVLTVTGDMDCVITFILNENFTRVMLKTMLGSNITDLKSLNEMEQSAICEVGNVMCNSYLNALSIMADLKMNVSVPSICIDSTEGILDTFVRRYVDKTDELMFIENTFYYKEQELVSHILMHPKFQSIKELLTKMGVE